MKDSAQECIDAHHHLWEYNPAQYGWMSDDMEVLRRDFLLRELEAVTLAGGVTGTVAVQARQTLEETAWLLRLSESSELIRGVVGWVDLISDSVRDDLSRFSQDAKLKGVRHVLHDEADDEYMLRADFKRGVGMLEEFGLRYDLLIFERHLPQTLQLVDEFPRQLFVVDHIGKPKIRDRLMEPWASRMRELGRREHLYCKLSGMVTEGDWASWSEEQLLPYFDVVLEAFTPERVMFGSDWPVLEVATDYGAWVGVVRRAIAGLTSDERRRVMAGTAQEFYAL